MTPSDSSIPNAGAAQTGASSATRRTTPIGASPTNTFHSADLRRRSRAASASRPGAARAPSTRRAPWRPTRRSSPSESNAGDFGSAKCGGLRRPSRARRRAAPRAAAGPPPDANTEPISNSRTLPCMRARLYSARRASVSSTSRRRYASVSDSGFVRRTNPSPPDDERHRTRLEQARANQRLANALRRDPLRIVADAFQAGTGESRSGSCRSRAGARPPRSGRPRPMTSRRQVGAATRKSSPTRSASKPTLRKNASISSVASVSPSRRATRDVRSAIARGDAASYARSTAGPSTRPPASSMIKLRHALERTRRHGRRSTPRSKR